MNEYPLVGFAYDYLGEKIKYSKLNWHDRKEHLLKQINSPYQLPWINMEDEIHCFKN